MYGQSGRQLVRGYIALAAYSLAASGGALIPAVFMGVMFMQRGSLGITMFVLFIVLLASTGMGFAATRAASARHPDR